MRPATPKLARLSSAVRALGYATLLIAVTLAFAQQASAAPPTYQAARTIQFNTSTTLSVPWPAHAINDFGLLIIETQNQAVTLGANAANWTPVTNSPQGTGTTSTGTKLTVFWSRATSTSMGAVGVNDAGDHQIAQILTSGGVTTSSNAWCVTAGDVTPSTTTAVSIPGATTTVQVTLVVAIVSNGSDINAAQIPGSFTNSDLSSVTKQQDNQTTASGGGGFTVATGSKALAGAYGPTSATLGFSSLQGRMSIALRPPFTKLQLLMPGETAAPGTGSGKTGTPNAQTAGTAFTVTVNAVDANWYLVNSVSDTVGITSSDGSASLPGNAALSSGTMTFSVTLNTAGTKTVTASDITNTGMTADTSPSTTVSAVSWYATNWAYRKILSIDQTKVGATGAPHANFPVLVSRTDTDLQSKAQSTGNDILFTSSDGTTKLSHEIEKDVSSTGELVAWVKVPSVSSSAATVIYMYYGYASAANQQNVVNTWDANFKAVWHLKEDPGGTGAQMKDSTVNANHGTAAGSMTSANKVAGMVGDGTNFDGVANQINLSGFSVITAPWMLEFWIRPVDLDTQRRFFFNLDGGG